jgi:hypothetical protein
MPIVLIFISDPPRYYVPMVETTILARYEAVLESGAGSIPSLEVEPPIVQGRKTCEWQMPEAEQGEEVQRWTAKRRSALVISLLKGETTVAEAARRHGLKVAEVEEGRERFLLGAENARCGRDRKKTRPYAKKRSIGSSARWVS